MERFEATVEARGRGGRAVMVPLDVPALFGKVRAPVRGTVSGFPYRSTIMRYGDTYYLGLNREVREGAGVEAGDRVTIEMELDEAPREVEVPDELERALGEYPDARASFEGLSYTHRREYARWIGEAKREETRRTRAEKGDRHAAERRQDPRLVIGGLGETSVVPSGCAARPRPRPRLRP